MWAARGAVRPSPSMAWTNARRLSVPALTWPIMCLSSCSCIDGPPGRVVGGDRLGGPLYTASRPKLSSYPPGSTLSLLVPVGQPPEGGIPAGQIHALQRVDGARDPVAPEYSDRHHVGDHHVVHLDEQSRALDWVDLAVRRLVGPVVLVAAEAGAVAPLPLVGLLRDLPRAELVHEVAGVRRGHRGVVHLQIGVEVRVGIGVRGIRGEEHRGHYRLDLDLDTRLGRRLLDDGLVLLARRVDRGLEDELEPLAVLGPDAVAAALPARRVEDLVGSVHAELPAGVLREEPRGRVQEVRGGLPAAAVDLLLDRGPVHQQTQG